MVIFQTAEYHGIVNDRKRPRGMYVVRVYWRHVAAAAAGLQCRTKEDGTITQSSPLCAEIKGLHPLRSMVISVLI